MDQPTYTPVVLKSLAEICKAFGVGTSRVREWVQAGAPIAVEQDAWGSPVRYRCELYRLYLWLERKDGRDVVKK